MTTTYTNLIEGLISIEPWKMLLLIIALCSIFMVYNHRAYERGFEDAVEQFNEGNIEDGVCHAYIKSSYYE
jgi:hypothetical protein